MPVWRHDCGYIDMSGNVIAEHGWYLTAESPGGASQGMLLAPLTEEFHDVGLRSMYVGLFLKKFCVVFVF